MIVYLIQKYFVNSLVFFVALVIFPLGFTGYSDEVILRGFVFGGIFGGLYTFYDFKKRRIWPLYDNLIIPKYYILFSCFIGFQLIYYLFKAVI